jgi:nitroreductase
MSEVPAIVLFLQARIPWEPNDDQGPLDIGRLDASVYPAVQNFCVAARALGLGTTLTTVIRVYGDEVLAALGVPAGRFEIAALVPVGHPTGAFGIAPRKPAPAVTHWNDWGVKRR